MKSTVTQQVIVTLSEQEVTEIIKQHLSKHGKDLAPNCNVKWDNTRLEISVDQHSFSISAIVHATADSKVVTNPIYNGV